MKSKQVKEYLGKLVTYRDVWNKLITAKLVKVDRYFATFEMENGNTVHIKTFNIAQIQEEDSQGDD